MKKNYQPILNLIYSVIGIVFLNAIIQFVLYPFLNKQLGDESFGIVLTMLSMISVISSSLGLSVNYARMVIVKENETKNGDYNFVLLIFNIIGIAAITIFLIIYRQLSIVNVVMLNLLMIITMVRYYGDVEYRKNLNYFSFMIYYILIGVGYGLGCLLYMVIPNWQLAMLIGEIAALVFVFLKGNIFKNFFKRSNNWKKILSLSISLCIGELIANLLLNSDRLLLYIFEDGTSVTTYYVASLIGKIIAMVTGPLNGVIIGYLSRYDNLDKKFKLIYISIVLVMGLLAIIGCLFISPIFIKILYPNTYDAAMEIIVYAVVGQVVFFCSNVCTTLIIKFYHSNYQLIISIVSLVFYATVSIIGVVVNGLVGFSMGSMFGNVLRLIFIVVIILFAKQKKID